MSPRAPSSPFIARARRPRRSPGTMNKTETAYSRHLDVLKAAGRVLDWHYEALTFKLADDTRYTPDFLVITDALEVELHEVKGFWEDDALVKIKVAARLFPFRFLAVTAERKRDGGGWTVRDFAPRHEEAA